MNFPIFKPKEEKKTLEQLHQEHSEVLSRLEERWESGRKRWRISNAHFEEIERMFSRKSDKPGLFHLQIMLSTTLIDKQKQEIEALKGKILVLETTALNQRIRADREKGGK
jgi:hypothetical protein